MHWYTISIHKSSTVWKDDGGGNGLAYRRNFADSEKTLSRTYRRLPSFGERALQLHVTSAEDHAWAQAGQRAEARAALLGHTTLVLTLCAWVHFLSRAHLLTVTAGSGLGWTNGGCCLGQ